MVFGPNHDWGRFKWQKYMTFHYYDIIIRPIDPEIEIDFDAHGFLLFLAHFACVHFTLLYKALEGRCGGADFWKYDFQKSIFSPCGMNGYEHDLGRSETNLDVFYPILNLFFALEVRNHSNPKSHVA